MNLSPLWLTVSYLLGRARSRARAARNGDPESGALTLECMIIAALIAGAAVTAAAVFGAKGLSRRWMYHDRPTASLVIECRQSPTVAAESSFGSGGLRLRVLAWVILRQHRGGP